MCCYYSSVKERGDSHDLVSASNLLAIQEISNITGNYIHSNYFNSLYSFNIEYLIPISLNSVTEAGKGQKWMSPSNEKNQRLGLMTEFSPYHITRQAKLLHGEDNQLTVYFSRFVRNNPGKARIIEKSHQRRF